MVGIPRSQNCHTCRRRRTGCDRSKPSCQRCQTDGRICEGYQRYATYVNRSLTGIQKRRRLEEVILPTSTHHKTAQDTKAQETKSPLLEIPSEKMLVSKIDCYGPAEQHMNVKPLIGAFLEIYQPILQENRQGVTLAWLYEACNLEDQCQPLLLCLQALAANRVASINGNEELARQSCLYYVKALQELNATLEHPEISLNGQILAAIRCLMIYELFESSNKSVHAWASHENGLVRLVKMRGPAAFNDSFNRNLLMDTRSVSMISSIQHCVKSPFSETGWSLNRQPENLLEVEHQLYDIAFTLSHAYEDFDTVSESKTVVEKDYLDIMTRVLAAIANFTSMIGFLQSLALMESSRRGEAYWDLESAICLANILTLQLDASTVVYDAYQRAVLVGINQEPLPLPPGKHDREGWQMLVNQIIPILAYTTSDEMGLYGAQKSLFSLRMTLDRISRRALSGHEEASTIYANLMLRKGLRHTLDLNKLWGTLDSPSDD